MAVKSIRISVLFWVMLVSKSFWMVSNSEREINSSRTDMLICSEVFVISE